MAWYKLFHIEPEILYRRNENFMS